MNPQIFITKLILKKLKFLIIIKSLKLIYELNNL